MCKLTASILSAFPILIFLAIPSRGDDSAGTLVIPAQSAAIKTVGGPAAGGWNLWSDGKLGQRVIVSRAGTYSIVIRAWGSPAGKVWPEMGLLVDEFEVENVSVASAQAADYRFRVDLKKGTHEIAAGFLNDAMVGNEDRNLYLERITVIAPEGARAPVATLAEEDPRIAADRERAIVAATSVAIEQNRKSNVIIEVVDTGRRPVAGARVTGQLTRHEFLFGCNIYGFDQSRSHAENEEYKERFAGLFNYATVGFYWRWYEPQRGRPNYDLTDKVVSWCRERGIRMKGHPLLWGDEAGIPAWSAGQPDASTQRGRVEAILSRYHGKIGFYEVVNEPSHQPIPLIDEPYRWAHAADPDAYLIVNDYHVFADGAPGFFRLLSRAVAQGVPFDGIGIQAHEPRTMRFPLDRVQAILDRYATLGKELHITEFTPASGGSKITGSHLEGRWDEAAQADYAVKFYRVCFAHPAVRAITWWDLSDQHSWLKGGGMLRADMTSKPVYDQLKLLIQDEWTTRVAGTTDATGHLAFRGFRGAYKITVAKGERQVERSIVVAKGDGQRIRVEWP
jgi:GH35 family endo-1,4-beta-xylanase